ncbi:uncharacterized protein LOC121727595 [Aricia agestis]|uniref:uncharacterized protein LOC121727595 n=1 Tax=Aricia agestis TaxID=91739 RepID=UPI001C2057EA|nr:uncharacterized protein LOC121727595 [Aricia agestis]
MESVYFILAIFVQGLLVHAAVDEKRIILEEFNNNGFENEVLIDDVKDDKNKNEWMDIFLDANSNLYPAGSSAAKMAQATFSDKSPEEQLEEIKEMANQITLLIQNEMANLLSYAMGCVDRGEQLGRQKRSAETPMDSTQLVMRLLKHIKSNNEYQNIAIEKMMTAQEIADKYGIPFTPDTDILTDLAKNANEQAFEMTSILKDSCDMKNSSQCKVIDESISTSYNNNISSVVENEKVKTNNNSVNSTVTLPHNMSNENVSQKRDNDYLSPYYYYNWPETQIVAPDVDQYSIPVTSKPTFYDTISYNPMFDYPYCSLEPINNVHYLNDFEPEPILTGEEYEETVSSKVFIEHTEPGAGTVNHVTTYTLSEKAHFKTPEIEQLPQQMQYYFFLM